MEKKSDFHFKKGVFTGIFVSLLIGMIVFLGTEIYQKNLSSQIQNQGVPTAGGTSKADSVVNTGVESKLQVLEKYVQNNFLFDADQQNLEDGVYKGYMSGLDDPYSSYYTKEEYARLNESIDGSYYGIGVMVTQDPDSGIVEAVRVFEGCPGAEAGVQPGDYIYKVGDIEVTGMDLNEVVSYVKGEEGTSVVLTVYRNSDNQYHELTAVRRKVESPTVNYEMLEDNIGYLEITEFDQVTVEQFKQAIQALNDQGMNGLIVDVRNNPGGLLEGVVEILDELLPEGKVVYTEDKNGKGQTYYSDEEKQFTKPLAVLINENSASASEIFAGAVKDYHIGTLVGTKTFGKGIVQNIYPLSDGSALKLTVSRYFTPSGVCIHEIGIEPDITVELNEEVKSQINVDRAVDNQFQQAVKVIHEKLGK